MSAPVDLTPVVGFSAGRKALFVDGVVQSVDADDAGTGYWNAMVPDERPAAALLLGVGGGTVAQLLLRRYGDIVITGVDDSADILRVARRGFGLSAPEIVLIESDAFAFVNQTLLQFDYIGVDLYRGNRLARGVLALPFLRTLRARLQPGGRVAYNLFRDVYLDERVARLERVFDRVRLDEVAANAVFHGRPRRRQR
ncbi:MAG: spermidine synthase [Dehalococcoidia bacterium]